MRAVSSVIVTVAVVFLATCLQTGDPYYREAADISKRSNEEAEALIEDAWPDLEACERSLFSHAACDRAVSKLASFSDIADRTRIELMALDPPSEARRWHSDMMELYADGSETINDMVDAYYSGDYDGFLATLSEFESIAAREDQLSIEFKRLQD